MQGLTEAGRVAARATAIASIGAAILHASAAADHGDMPAMRAGFLVVAALQLALGALLLARLPGRRLRAAAVVLMLSAIGLWLVSRTVGLPLVPGAHVEPVGLKDGVTVLFELAALRGLLLAAPRGARPVRRGGGRALAATGAAGLALLVSALVVGEGEHRHDDARTLGSAGHSEGGHGLGAGSADANGAAHADGGDAGHGGDRSERGAGHTGAGERGAGHAGADGHARSSHPSAGHDGTTQLASLGGGGTHGHDTPAADRDATHRDRGRTHAGRPHRGPKPHRRRGDRKPGKGHGHGPGKGDDHHHEHPPEPEDEGPLATLADALPAVGALPPPR